MNYSQFGEVIVHEGKRDELVEILIAASKLLSKNTDCLRYLVSVSEDSPDSVFVFETWQNKESHKNCLNDSAVIDLIMKGKPLIKQMKQQKMMSY